MFVPQKSTSYPYPSRYGSHVSMIDEEKTGELPEENRVVLQDEHGYYVTDRKRLDDGLADPKRSSGSRLSFFL